jgi:hypothetical protein
LSSKDKLEIIVERLFKLFDVKPSPDKETTLFSNHKAADHNEVCKAFEYWLDQTKMVFGEVAYMTQNQSLRDSGVDLLIDLPLSQLRFGVQAKSFNDIQESNFAKNVKAQITESHRHTLDKLIIAFAGDLTHKKQPEKVRGLISELHQVEKDGNNYIFMIPPEKVLTIYSAYKAGDHPLKHVLLENKDAFIFAMGMEDSLSSETRKAKVRIEIEYIHPNGIENYPYKIEVKYKVDEHNLDIVDRIEHLPQTKDFVKLNLDQINHFRAYDKEGNVLSNGNTTELFIWGDNNPIVILNLATITENEKLLNSVDGLVFEIVRKDNLLNFNTKDEDHPLKLQLIFHLNSSRLEFKMGINYDKGDAVTLLECVKFLQSLKAAKKLRYFNCNTGGTGFFELPTFLDFKVDPLMLDFITSLATLQRHTRKVFKLPQSLTNERFIKELRTARVAARIADTKNLLIRPMKIILLKSMAATMIDDYMQQRINDDLIMRIPYLCMVLDQRLVINESTLNLSQIQPSGDLIQLLKTIKEEQKDYVEIEMIAS